MTDIEMAERNEFAVLLSEELQFLEELAEGDVTGGDIALDVLERRDVLRAALQALAPAKEQDKADEGTPLP